MLGENLTHGSEWAWGWQHPLATRPPRNQPRSRPCYRPCRVGFRLKERAHLDFFCKRRIAKMKKYTAQKAIGITIVIFVLFLALKPNDALAWFKDIKWGMTPEELVRKFPQISLYSQRQKSGFANVYMFAGTRLKTENGIVTIEYGGLGPNSNLEIIMVFVQDPTRNQYFEYKKMLEGGYGIPERSTEISGSLKHPVGKGMLESHWDEFDRKVIITLVYNDRGNPPRLNMTFSSIKVANKIMEFYNRK